VSQDSLFVRKTSWSLSTSAQRPSHPAIGASRGSAADVHRVLVVAIALWLTYSFGVLFTSLHDAYVPCTGTVVAKDRNRYVLPVIGSPARFLVIRDALGGERRRYVSETDYVMADLGTFVVKPRGFFQRVARPGQLAPRQVLDSIRKRRFGR
jgi:hypothetical protein